MRPSFLFAAIAISAVAFFARARGGERAPSIDDAAVERLVFFSVLEGCYEDGVSNEAVDSILRRDERGYSTFVYGCPICRPTIDALVLYRGRKPFYSLKGEPDTFGTGLAPGEIDALRSDDAPTRFAALQALVGRWVGRRLALLRPTEEERGEWATAIARARKQGMSSVDLGTWPTKGCPSCDGALGGCRPAEAAR
jgi:hypothetical protein